jgi:uncharacterized glyoxalase superfamily protein PhnB
VTVELVPPVTPAGVPHACQLRGPERPARRRRSTAAKVMLNLHRMARLSRIAPEIPVSNLREAIEYYERKLGFRVAMEMPVGDYAIVERDDLALHLFQDDTRSHSPVGLHIFTHELEQLREEIVQRGTRLSQEIMQQPWGNRDFRVTDDWGNEIKFTEPLLETA